jgi:hypothetical protein
VFPDSLTVLLFDSFPTEWFFFLFPGLRPAARALRALRGMLFAA